MKIGEKTFENGQYWTDTVVGQLVISQVTHAMTPEQQDAFHAARAARTDKSVELKLTIDGIETDVGVWINRVDDALNKHITDEAGGLLKEKLGTLTNQLFDTLIEIDRGLKQEAAKLLGYDPWKDD